MENQNHNPEAPTTRAEIRAAAEPHRIGFVITDELFASLAQRYNVSTERELADALRLGLYKQANIARPATKQEIRAEQKRQAKIAKLEAEIAALKANR